MSTMTCWDCGGGIVWGASSLIIVVAIIASELVMDEDGNCSIAVVIDSVVIGCGGVGWVVVGR